MKVERISEHVWSLSTWVIIPIHVWAVAEKDGITLVDAGISMMSKGIIAFAEKTLGKPVRRIVLTHGHSDHTGAISKLLAKYPDAGVWAHEIEIPYMEGRMAYPGRKKAQQSVQPGLAQPIAGSADGETTRIGGLSVHLTPGHSPGHVVYYHEQDGVMLAGDLFTSKKGRLKKPMPMFTADMAEAVRSSEIVRKLRPKRLEVCHGNSVLNPADQLDAYQKSQRLDAGKGVSLPR
ncbi:MBL fold metallo-hydrolase [Paenibacillus sacheonensis]|uniref:MBL fold metallo-hydrolase n=1 Tax=Paenibacillus sacheonensis TaxID=742054 RepID=A0A7X4YU60_9BACL|nr:MBL fold metallo-hydrolase [Paenibacillus sacheonensis]MBM7566912.1 glyoxylase-like metal-dependent hydrolase (beta-lactamase superfamily II) [Paenibacillus sacheonensis]NBC71534.1 MBL fold metallo-hydrolase [Paenibacillus sacheonensis]